MCACMEERINICLFVTVCNVGLNPDVYIYVLVISVLLYISVLPRCIYVHVWMSDFSGVPCILKCVTEHTHTCENESKFLSVNIPSQLGVSFSMDASCIKCLS